VLAGVLIAATVAAGADAERQAVEHALREGRIVSVAPLGEGVTNSSRVELRDGERTVQAVFKTADQRMKSRYAFGAETVKVYRDTWRHEMAAYVLDTRLGFSLVPPTVEREIDGKKGSLQAWVDRSIARFEAAMQPPLNMDHADDAVQAMRLLDYLIFNSDRHVRNVVFTSDWRPVAIDNSIAFHAFVRPYRPMYRFPRGPLERLRRLEPGALDAAVAPWLEKDERAALRERRQRVLRLADSVLAALGEKAALFDW
jgi:hypothetical protein